MIDENRLRPGIPALLLALALAGCATTTEDPLRNTKKLVVEGHTSLYRNGAFAVPNTSLKLIPAGPEAHELALELAGLRARESFVEAVRRAGESVQVVAEGSKLSYRWASKVHEGTDDLAHAITDASRGGGVVLIDRSLATGKNIIGASWDTARHLQAERGATGDRIVERARAAGNRIADAGGALGGTLVAGSQGSAKAISADNLERSSQTMRWAGRRFAKGYAALPAALERRGQRIGDRLSELNPVLAARASEEFRATWSQKSVDLFSDTLGNYGRRAGASFAKARRELAADRLEDSGVSLAALKSLRWVLQGIFWDATIEPVGNLTAASLGYVGVNLVAYPTMVVVREGVATTNLAVELTKDAAGTAYDLVAPSTVAAVAAVFAATDFVASQSVSGATAAGGTVAGYGVEAAGHVAAVSVKASGHLVGRSIEYIGVPLASAGIVIGGGTVGTVVGTAGSAAGGTLLVGGEIAGGGTQVFGNVLAGTTLVGGTAISAAGGATYGVYQLSKAVIVPAGYELGAGMVVSYGAATQLAAQSVLAVSDCAYLVLSLEGPRWVVYAVRGKVDDGRDLPAGAVVDLKAMHEAGEEIFYLPVSDDEMQRVVESAYETLPAMPQR